MEADAMVGQEVRAESCPRPLRELTDPHRRGKESGFYWNHDQKPRGGLSREVKGFVLRSGGLRGMDGRK